MKNIIVLIATLIGLMCGVSGSHVIYAEEKEYHGADSVFQAEDIAIFWAILKGADDESSQVYIKIFALDETSKKFVKFSVLAVDPFSKEEQWVCEGKEFQPQNLLILNRASFKDMMERRFFFYATEETEEAKKPGMVVYYLSIPDTAPEFLKADELEAYFKDALARLKKD